MRKAFILTTIILASLLAGCDQDEGVIPEPDGLEKSGRRVISLTASMPSNEDPSDTRLALQQDGLNIKLTWEAGDKIYFIFEEREGGTAKGKQTVTLTENDIFNEVKKARFDLVVPDEITTPQYSLCGVYGVQGFVSDESYEFSLKPAPWSGGSLTELQGKDVMALISSQMLIEKSDFTISFKHIGALFRIVLMNTNPCNTKLRFTNLRPFTI